MRQSERLNFYHDTDGLDYISAFASSLKQFGLYVADVTEEGQDSISVIITDESPEKEWEY